MRFELTTTDLEGRSTTSCATEMSKKICAVCDRNLKYLS